MGKASIDFSYNYQDFNSAYRKTMPPITTHEYRKKPAIADRIERMKAQGIEDVDVCHIISKSNGGADSADNYILANAAFNKAIGNQWDELMIYVAYQEGGMDRVRKAIKASPKSELKEEKAEELVEKGKEEWNRRKLKYEEIGEGTYM